tara:strand:- start:1987 stop:2424 length:438 start_codon:yes stop_codon:yes gene_type:complete
MKGNVRPSMIEDAYALHTKLRAADLLELTTLGVDPLESLVQGHLRAHPQAYSVVVKGQVAGMFGVCPGIEPKFGCVWLLGSEDLLEIQEQLLRDSKAWLDVISKDYDLIYNVVHELNSVHIRWIEFLGFKFLRHTSPHIEFARIP